MITLDLPGGGKIDCAHDDVVILREAAASQAGRSSVARDLSLLLDRALEQRRPLALRRGEVRALHRLAEKAGLRELAERLDDQTGASPA